MTLTALVTVASLTLFALAALTLWWQMYAWRTPETYAATRFAPPDGDRGLSFSLLLPARHEEEVLGATVRQLLRAEHIRFEVLLIVGHDDPATRTVAELLAAQSPDRVRVIVDRHEVKNKPKALNTALPYCRGVVTGVIDAEDQVHPELLTHVDHTFRTTRADVVQGGVQLMNFQSSWYSLRNCLEYFFWFRSRLHLQAAKGFIPLGGNTVFVRTALLRDADGWDPECLAEDCDLGVRLSSRGARTVVAYDPLLVTREETPGSLLALLKQRTRWNQGFLQVHRKGEWRRLPRLRQRVLARYTLATPFLQAFTGLLIPLNLAVALFAHVPVGATALSFLPTLALVVTLVFEGVGLHDFGRQYGQFVRAADYAKLLLGAPAYQLLLAAAAIRAVWREARGRSDWELTRHTGAHLAPDAPPSAALPPASAAVPGPRSPQPHEEALR
ncbi:glycosyltransferase [Streptomyces boncukensis]|uniref:glycosyltransferase n=1 Tax=Streptomyces boncukensis TaxID=2711219 RepID=UPI0030B9C631